MAGAMADKNDGNPEAPKSGSENGGPSAPEGSSTGTAEFLVKKRGRCKWFNVAKGWGFITPDDGSPDVFVHQSVIKMTGFRSLGDKEVVEFICKTSDKGFEATHVSGIDDSECKGSTRRPLTKKRFKKIRCAIEWQKAINGWRIKGGFVHSHNEGGTKAGRNDVFHPSLSHRCYNCGEFANHIAAKCNLDPQPKRCHFCRSDRHLVVDCQMRATQRQGSNNEVTNNGTVEKKEVTAATAEVKTTE